MKTIIFTLIFVVYVQSVFSVPGHGSHSHTTSSSSEVYEEPEFHSSIRTRNTSLFEQLLPFEEDLNIRNSRDQSPLTLSIILSETGMMTSLLEGGAQLDLKNKIDQGALRYASRFVKKILKKYNQIGLFCRQSFRR